MGFQAILAQAMEYDYGEYTPSYETVQGMRDASAADVAAASAVLMGMMVFVLIATLIGYVINSIFLGRLFKKAGVEQWKAWVPVYNVWVMLELGGQKGWWAILMLVPVVNIVATVFYFIAAYHIGLKLGKEGVFVLLAIFLPIVWLIWLAVDKSTWNGATPAPVAATPVAPAQPVDTPVEAEEPKPPVPPTTPPTTPPTAQ